MTAREGDARTELPEDTQRGTWVYKNAVTGEVMNPEHVHAVRGPTGKPRHIKNPPPLTQAEQTQAAATVQAMLDNNELRYPELAQSMLARPETLIMLPELQLMLDPAASENGNEQSYDMTADLASAILEDTAQAAPAQVAAFQQGAATDPTMVLFWETVGDQFDELGKEAFMVMFTNLDEESSLNIAALSMAWAESQDLGDPETRARLLEFAYTESFKRQQSELGKKGFFGFLEAGQDFLEGQAQQLIEAGLETFGSADAAVRRKDLSIGQNAAYQTGQRPEDWGWNLVSGSVDASDEFYLDPLSYVAGVGIGVKAAKTVPLAANVTKAGRAAMAARSLLPKFFTGQTRQVGGGRFARVTYSLRAKTFDELVDGLAKPQRVGSDFTVADDILRIAKRNDQAELARRYPSLARMTDEVWDAIQTNAETAEEVVQVLKAGTLNDALRSADDIDRLAREAAEGWEAAARHADETVVLPYADEDYAKMDEVVDFESTANTALDEDTVNRVLRTWTEEAVEAEDEVVGTFTQNGLDFTVWQGERKAATAAINPDAPSRQITYVADGSGRILGGYDEGHFVVAPEARGIGLMSRALEVTEDAGTSFLPRMMERATSPTSSFTDDAARWVRNRAQDRLDGKRAPRGPELIGNEAIPRQVQFEATLRQLRLDAAKSKPSQSFVIYDIPTRPKTLAWNNVLTKVGGTGRFQTGLRRNIARSTPGRIPDEIELFNTRKGADQLRRVFEHYGMRTAKIDELINDFMATDLGARQDWFWDTAMRELGRETNVPVLQHNLVSFYKKGGIREFSGSGKDLWVDELGNGHRHPLLPTHMTSKMPLPVRDIDQIVRRSNSINNRSKAARALGWNGRGLNNSRADVARKLKAKLAAKGEDVNAMDEDAIWDMAFSVVSDTGLDGRGWWTAKVAPKAGSTWNTLHRAFTKSMLIFRPLQWMWRVAILEEPIRSHMFNMPSMYRNPLQYMGAAREAHYLSRAQKWRARNIDWANDATTTLLRGVNDSDALATRLDSMGLKDDFFPDGVPASFSRARAQATEVIEQSIYSRTRLNRLAPIKKVGFAAKHRAGNLETVDKMTQKLGLPQDFDLVDDVAEIQQKLLKGYLAGTIGATETRAAQWTRAMLDDQAFSYGQTYGMKLAELANDRMGQIAIRRVAARLRGEQPGAGIDAAAVIDSPHWDLMRHDLARRFGSELTDEQLAKRYMTALLEEEVRYLMAPFLDNAASLDEAAALLDNFAQSRRIETTLGDAAVDIDLRNANYAKGTREMGDLVAGLKGNVEIEFPQNVPAPSFNPHFMAEDDPGWFRRMGDWVLQTFGEQATQELNRRPAWLREFRRWKTNYENIGIAPDMASSLARDHASQMVNYVFFNMDEAPYMAEKLNRAVPFFGATYEVLGAWTYKMPVAVGGTWPTGVGEFGRKFQRLMDAFVNLGLVTREEEDDGTITHTLNLVPAEQHMREGELGGFLSGAGFAAVNTVDSVVATILSLEDGLELRDQGYRLAVGDPLNFSDYGILSFAQANLGLSPVANVALTALAHAYPRATDSQRVVAQPGESLADIADRLNVDVSELVRLNRGSFMDDPTLGKDVYNGILAGLVDPVELKMPQGLPIRVPDTNFFSNFTKDMFQPFGDVSDINEFGINFIPGTMRWMLNGIMLQNQPTDSFWKGEYQGAFAGLLPTVNQAQVSSQLAEAFMYTEAHDIVDGKGPFARLQAKEARLAQLIEEGKVDEANELRSEIELDTEHMLERIQTVAADSLILRSLTGQMLPTSPGHVRREHELIQGFWASREYADSIQAGEGKTTFLPFKDAESIEKYLEQVGTWLSDPTGDKARANFAANYPQLMAYLTPKTFYAAEGAPPEITSFEEYQNEIETGKREVAPLHITMSRAQSAAIQADYYTKYIATFGSDPQKAAAAALNDREAYNGLQDQRNLAYQALYMHDDMHGGLYDSWQAERFSDNWALEQVTDRLNTVRDNLGIVIELEETMELETDLAGIENLNGSLKAAIAEISGAIRAYEEEADRENFRNAYEDAINDYFKEVYIPYQEGLSALYDKLDITHDSEKQSLIYEEIKLYKNDFTGANFFLNGDATTPFPSPLDYSWNGKTDEEQRIKRQQWATRPLEWIDQDSTRRIVEHKGFMEHYLPTSDGQFEVYRQFTLDRIVIDEMLENGEISPGEATKLRKAAEAQRDSVLLAEGRTGELEFMEMAPIEKLEVMDDLPPQLGIFTDHVRYYKQVLAVEEVSANSTKGRQIVMPLYDMAESMAYHDENTMNALLDIGENLYDKNTLDNILPWLFFGSRGER